MVAVTLTVAVAVAVAIAVVTVYYKSILEYYLMLFMPLLLHNVLQN